MAHLPQNLPSISKLLYRESSGTNSYTSKQSSTIWMRISINGGKVTRSVDVDKGFRRKYRCSCSSSASSSSSSSTEEMSCLVTEKVELSYLASENGWNVRKIVAEDSEMRKVAQVQAEAFHVPVPFFNDFFYEFFQAEVLTGLLYRLRNSPPDRYTCLVAEPSTDTLESRKEVVGVVDVTVLNDQNVVQYLDGAEEYLYISGIAVLNNFRRQKVATALLKACDNISILWGFEYLALRAYEDDWGARKLYTSAGYNVVSGDPPWMSSWIGRKRRLLLIKRSNLRDWY